MIFCISPKKLDTTWKDKNEETYQTEFKILGQLISHQLFNSVNCLFHRIIKIVYDCNLKPFIQKLQNSMCSNESSSTRHQNMSTLRHSHCFFSKTKQETTWKKENKQKGDENEDLKKDTIEYHFHTLDRDFEQTEERKRFKL